MDNDRKYKQHGYREVERERPSDGRSFEERQRQPGPRPPLDVTGPRLPRLVQNVVAARCYNCSTTLPADTDFRGNCPKCNAALHCCKQCAHFEPSKLFQCLKPVPARIRGEGSGERMRVLRAASYRGARCHQGRQPARGEPEPVATRPQ